MREGRKAAVSARRRDAEIEGSQEGSRGSAVLRKKEAKKAGKNRRKK